MKNILALVLLALAFSGCTPMKRAQTSIARGVGGNEVIKVGQHEVYCSQGRVCSEVDVLAIAMEKRDGGKVMVTLKNRTGDTVLVQIRLQIRNQEGQILFDGVPDNFAIPATQEKNYEMPGVAKLGGSVRVLLNTAY